MTDLLVALAGAEARLQAEGVARAGEAHPGFEAHLPIAAPLGLGPSHLGDGAGRIVVLDVEVVLAVAWSSSKPSVSRAGGAVSATGKAGNAASSGRDGRTGRSSAPPRIVTVASCGAGQTIGQ